LRSPPPLPSLIFVCDVKTGKLNEVARHDLALTEILFALD